MNKQERQARKLAIAQDLREGMKQFDVARKYGLTPQYISWVARQQGAGLTHQARRARKLAIVQDLRKGMKYVDAAQKYGLTREYIGWIAKQQAWGLQNRSAKQGTSPLPKT